MGRYYKTASATPLDYMYKANTPLMEKVLLTNDQYITQNLNQADKLDTAATSFPYLQPDDSRAKEIGSKYSSQIDDVVNQIKADPANWRKHVGTINDISRDLQSNYKTGEISKISDNYSKYKKVSDYLDTQIASYNKNGKGISPDRAKAYKEYFMRNFITANPNGTGYNSSTGEYNSMNTFDPMANIDIRKQLGEELDKIKADKKLYKRDEITGNEQYFNEKTQSWEGVTPEKILGIVTDRLHNPQLMDYLKQDTQAGILNGVFDKNGNFINPYSYESIPATGDEQNNIKTLQAKIAQTKDTNIKQQLQGSLNAYQDSINNRKQLNWNSQSYLSPIMQGLVSQYSNSKTEESNKLRNNSVWNTKFTQGQENFRQGRNLVQQKQLADDREKGLNDRAAAQLSERKYEWDNPHASTKGTTGTTKPGAKPGTATTDNTGTKLPDESTVSKLSTNSFEDWTTIDSNGQTVKVLSTQGLSADIGNKRDQLTDTNKQISGLDSQMKTLLGNRSESDLGIMEATAYNNLKIKKQSLEQTVPQLQSDLNARRKWYQASVEAALTNNTNAKKDKDGNLADDLSPEEIALYHKYDNDREAKKLQEQIGISASGYLLESMHTGKIGILDNWFGSDANDENYKQRKEYTDYLNVKKKVDDRRDNFLAQMRYTPIDTDAINVNADDSKAIGQMIFTNPQGVKLFDNTGNRTDKLSLEGKGISWFAPSGDNYKMSTVDDKLNLVNYMLKHNVTPKVEQVGNTTKIGSGNAVVKVTFNDPNGEIPSTPFYLEVTPELQKQIGTRLGLSKDPGVKAITDNMLDDEANDIRKQLITPTVQRTAGASDNYDPVTFTIMINNGNTKIPFQVTKFAAADGTDHLNITGSINGQQTPLPNTDSGVPGWFNGADDFIKYIKKLKAPATNQ